MYPSLAFDRAPVMDAHGMSFHPQFEISTPVALPLSVPETLSVESFLLEGEKRRWRIENDRSYNEDVMHPHHTLSFEESNSFKPIREVH